MSVLGVRIKAPEARRDADVSFDRWLVEGDHIVSANAEADSDELDIESVQVFDEIVKVWISGGLNGRSYTVKVIVTTDQGRIQTACFRVRVSDCSGRASCVN